MIRISSFLLACVSGLGCVSVRSEETVESLKKKRLALHESIVRQRSLRYSNGLCGLDEVIKAEIRLVKLKRRFSIAFQEKQSFLEKLLELEERRFEALNLLLRAGNSEVSSVDVQRSQLKLLARKQKLLEAKAKAK